MVFKVSVCSVLLDQDSSPHFQTRFSISPARAAGASLRAAVERGRGWKPPQPALGRKLSRAGLQSARCKRGVQAWGAGVQSAGCRHAERGVEACRVWGAGVQSMGCKRGVQACRAWGAGVWGAGVCTAEAPSAGCQLPRVAETLRRRCQPLRRNVYLFCLQSIGKVRVRLAKPEVRFCPFTGEDMEHVSK